MDKSLIYKNNYLNCEQSCISAILSRSDINVDLIWKQAGLLFKEVGEIFYLSPYYKDYSSDFLENHNIKLIEYHYSKEQLNRIVDDIYSSQKLNLAICVTCDPFYLPYYKPYYKKFHSRHMIEIIKINKEKSYIVDHTLLYQGELSTIFIKEAITSPHTNDRKLITIETKSLKDSVKSTTDIINNIKYEYLHIMAGNPLYNFKQENYSGATIGLEAIREIEEYILKYIDLEDQRESMNFLFKALREVCNSRFQIYKLFKSVNLIREAELFLESYQCWSILNNLVARYNLKNDISNIKSRIAIRTEQLYKHEKKILELL
ncbi:MULTISPECIES: hypothetical protein [unclassified Sutcliffiella]|uniref:hypothetical protein n=1 Tax=unclassified Sutcliffiella TaxID=2837532 RepID=UPI0030CF8C91